MRENICLHYFLFTLHLFTSPIPVVSNLPFLNTLRDYSRKYRTVYRHFRANWSIDSGKRYRWQLWPKLRLVKYHPAAPETGGRRKRTEKKNRDVERDRERDRENQAALYETIYSFFHFSTSGLPRFPETIIRLR